MNYTFNNTTYVQIRSLADKTVFNFVHTVRVESNFMRVYETSQALANINEETESLRK
jgi:hypothetical protein